MIADAPLRLEYLSGWQAAALFALLAAPIVWLAIRSLAGLGPVRRWVAPGVRLAALLLLVLILGGARWQRQHRDLEVVVLRDVSRSTANVPATGGDIQSAIVQFLKTVRESFKPPGDRLGVVRFDSQSLVEALPDVQFRPTAGTVQSASGAEGTDIASAIHLGLACFSGQAMKRLVLISDGNANAGDLEQALAAASASRVPVDVIPLRYRIDREVMIDRVVTPALVRQDQPFSVEVVVRSTHSMTVRGRLMVSHQGRALDLDAEAPGTQSSLAVMIQPGLNVFRLKIPAGLDGGLAEFRAELQCDRPEADFIAANNVADAFTFVRGRGKVLLVDNVPEDQSQHLLRALQSGLGDVQVVRISVSEFPSRMVELQSCDAVILANVPRGPGGLSEQQDQLLARYVHELGGGLVVIGGPEALGAGNWQGSELEKVLPVKLDIPARRVLPSGALVLVLDHSGSMSGPMPQDQSVTKQQVANESAVLALRTLLSGDYLGVIAFDSQPTWVVNLDLNRNPRLAEQRILGIQPAGGTEIGPALEQAIDALSRLTPQQAAVKRILLLTDGVSNPYDWEKLLARLAPAKITLSTVAVGADVDYALLSMLASRGGGACWFVDDPGRLMQVFVREARTLRRPYIYEPEGGIGVAQDAAGAELLKPLGNTPLPRLTGMVLTSRKADRTAQVPLYALNQHRDPILAYWQAGLGRSAVFAADATARWAADWIASPVFTSFWTHLVRSVARPTASDDFEVQMVRQGTQTRMVIEAANPQEAAVGYYSFRGQLAGPDQVRDIRPVQTGPGRYEAVFPTITPGNYLAIVQYKGPGGRQGSLLAGTTVSASVELQDLQSNEARMSQIAACSGGRVLADLDPAAADLFTRQGLVRSASSAPVWDILICLTLGIIILDVAVRRIAWDLAAAKRAVRATADFVRSFTVAARVEPVPTLDALKKIRKEVSQEVKPPAEIAQRQVEGDISELLGGAREKPAEPAAGRLQPPADASVGQHTSSLLAAKRRAQQQIRQKQQQDEQ